MISKAEWFFLIEYIVVVTYIESTKPKSRLDPALRAQLPPPLIELLASPQFVEACMQTFDGADKDKSGAYGSEG